MPIKILIGALLAFGVVAPVFGQSGERLPGDARSSAKPASTAYCDPQHALAKKYRNNFVQLAARGKYSKNLVAAGILVDNCSAILTVGHNLAEKWDNFVPLTEYRYKRFGILESVPLPEPLRFSEGNWKRSFLRKDDWAVIAVAKPSGVCERVPMLQEMNASKAYSVAEKGAKFFLLKIDLGSTYNLCAQPCTLAPRNHDLRTRDEDDGAVITAGCRTLPGNSGSPYFVMAPDGDYYLVGLVVGPHISDEWDVFAPVQWPMK